MNYSELKKYDIADGPGVRVSLFVSGCNRHCPGCHNESAWDFNSGKKVDSSLIKEIIQAISEPYISGFTVLGGEPMEPENASAVFEIMDHVKAKFPKKTIWLYSGFTYEELIKLYPDELRRYVDVLVDGPYIEELRDISLRFRGSKNQRIINFPASMSATDRKPVLWKNPIDTDPYFNTADYIERIGRS